jgi:hypothetical protein
MNEEKINNVSILDLSNPENFAFNFCFTENAKDKILLTFLKNGEIIFNKKEFPAFTENDFAKKFIEIVETATKRKTNYNNDNNHYHKNLYNKITLNDSY